MKQTHRFARYLACVGLIAGTLSLWGCGSASTYDPITPTRIVAFGDALVDVGQTGRVDANNAGTKYRFTVNQVETATAFNTGTVFIEAVATYFGLGTVSSALDIVGNLPSSGAYSYGEYGAMVLGDLGVGADSRGCVKDTNNVDKKYCANSLKAQIDSFFAKGAPSSNDLFVISIGTGDIMFNGRAAAGLTKAQTDAAMLAAAKGLAAQTKRLTDAGAKYVLIVGPPNLGRSPWAAASNGNDPTLLQNLSYNSGSGYTSMGSEGLAQIQSTFGNKSNNPVLFVEISGLVNTLTDGTNTTFANRTDRVCKNIVALTETKSYLSIDANLGQVSASVCTTATASLNGDPTTYVYADGVNFTTAMQSQFYSQALARMRLAAWIN